MIWEVRIAMRSDCSVGRLSASSKQVACTAWAPPSTAEGDAGGLAREAEAPRALILGAEALAHDLRPHATGGAELRHLLEEVHVRGHKERDARGEGVDGDPALHGALGELDRRGEGDRQLVHRADAGLAHVVAVD